jgi:protein-tyrosine phosphatase
MTAATFDVAFICTGNRFRSPLAAALLTAEVGELPVRPSSLGLLDLGSVGALEEAVEAGGSLGIDLSGHRTRCLADVDLEPFDLIIGFEWAHVQSAIVDGHAAIERTFTLPELVGLLRELDSDAHREPHERVSEAHARRPPRFMTTRPPEIPDPLGKPPAVQRRIAEDVRELVAELSRLLFS